jgi:hypothetical protein
MPTTVRYMTVTKQVIASTMTTTTSASWHLRPRNKVWFVAVQVSTCALLLLARSTTTAFAPMLVGRRPTSQLYDGQQTSPLTLEHVFTDDLFDEMADQVQATLHVPLPGPVVHYFLTQSLEFMTGDLSDKSLAQLQDFLKSESTSTKYDDLSQEQIDALAEQMAQEIFSSDNKVVDIPLLSPEREFEILQQLLRVVFQVLTSRSSESRVRFIDSRLELSKDLLSSPESRRKLAQTIHEAVDIPFLNESVLNQVVDVCASTLQQVLPPSLIEILKGESPEGVANMKEYVIQTVNEKVNLIGFNEEQEEAMIRTVVVDILLDTYLDGTQVEFLVFPKAERLAKLQEKKEELQKDIELSQLRFAREQSNLQAKLGRIQARFIAIETGQPAASPVVVASSAQTSKD